MELWLFLTVACFFGISLWYPCCCDRPPPKCQPRSCDYCREDPLTGEFPEVPKEMILRIDSQAITNNPNPGFGALDPCDDCDQWNQTDYILGQSGDDPCVWTLGHNICNDSFDDGCQVPPWNQPLITATLGESGGIVGIRGCRGRFNRYVFRWHFSSFRWCWYDTVFEANYDFKENAAGEDLQPGEYTEDTDFLPQIFLLLHPEDKDGNTPDWRALTVGTDLTFIQGLNITKDYKTNGSATPPLGPGGWWVLPVTLENEEGEFTDGSETQIQVDRPGGEESVRADPKQREDDCQFAEFLGIPGAADPDTSAYIVPPPPEESNVLALSVPELHRGN